MPLHPSAKWGLEKSEISKYYVTSIGYAGAGKALDVCNLQFQTSSSDKLNCHW